MPTMRPAVGLRGMFRENFEKQGFGEYGIESVM